MTQQYTTYKLNTLIAINPFFEQRDADKSRVTEIKNMFIQRLQQRMPIIDIPIVLVVDSNGDNCLRDKSNRRVNRCIVDGQHRVLAMAELIEENSKVSAMDIPCFLNMIENIQQAKDIQYSLFNQKPVDLIDKYVKSNYSIGDEIRECINLLENYSVENKFSYFKFKDERYSDTSKPRRTWFMSGELEYMIRNTLNIEKWIERQISGTELFECIMKMATCRKNSLTDSNYTEVLKLTTPVNIKSFKDKSLNNIVAYISTYYYKAYDKLVIDIEIELNIQELEEDEEEYNSC